jgi:hypothetical protein
MKPECQVILTAHPREMLTERNVAAEWVQRAISTPDEKRMGEEGHTHYLKTIEENGGRVLRVVVNTQVDPWRVVTAFFDRRLAKGMRGGRP